MPRNLRYKSCFTRGHNVNTSSPTPVNEELIQFSLASRFEPTKALGAPFKTVQIDRVCCCLLDFRKANAKLSTPGNFLECEYVAHQSSI